MVTLLVLAWLLPSLATAAIFGTAVRRRCMRGEGHLPVRLPVQRRGS